MKWCSRCGELKNNNGFHKDRDKKDGLHTICKLCRKNNDKEVKSSYDKKWYQVNRIKKLAYTKEWRKNNKNKIRQYLINNKDKITKQEKLYRDNAKDTRLKYCNSNAKYNLYYERLTVDESPILASDNISIEVKCKYCDKYFIPTVIQILNRVSSLNGTGSDCYLYCSGNCKDSCPIYRKIKYPNGFKKASSREVAPLVRQLCFKRDNWLCQICGASQKEAPLHCHHIEGYTQNPHLGNDVTNTITLCKTCHKEVHKLPGCNYYELRCNNNSS